MKNFNSEYKRIAIKVGSNVITKNDGSLNTTCMLRIVEEIAILSKQGIECILISSGAVAAGRNDVVPKKRTNLITAKQIWAAIGQVKLMSNYQFFFGKYGINAGQVLTVKESFRDRQHYLNMKTCISAMLDNNVLPIVNENDTISITELMFTDNDELSGLIASMMDCSALIILSNVDGIYTGTPGEVGSEVIRKVDDDSVDPDQYITEERSGFGRGGMITKCNIAKKIASEGIDVFIANGTRESIISDIVRGRDVPCTHFVAPQTKKSGVKKWLTHSETFARGIVYVNKGAEEALTGDKATSLLMVGVKKIDGFFKKGDVIRILDEKGRQLGIGKSQYDSKKAEQHIGEKMKKPLIHYHYMVMDKKEELT